MQSFSQFTDTSLLTYSAPALLSTIIGVNALKAENVKADKKTTGMTLSRAHTCTSVDVAKLLSKRRGRVKLLSASVKRFKVSLQPASGRGIRRWRPIIGVFCLFCCKIGLNILTDYINFAYLAVLLTKECIIELILLKLVYKQIDEVLQSIK